MRALWGRWVAAWTATESGRTLGAFRLALGLLVLWDCLNRVVVADPLYVAVADGGLAVPGRVLPYALPWLAGVPVQLLAGLGATLGAALAAGVGGPVGGRVLAFSALQVLLVLNGLPGDMGGGYDRLVTIALWLLVLGDGSAAWSVHCRRTTGRWTSDRLVAAFPRYLAVVQLVVVYVGAGLSKTGAGWDAPYEAVYRSLILYSYVRVDVSGLVADVAPLLAVGTVVSKWWEITFFAVGAWFVARRGWVGARWERAARRFDLRIPYLGYGVVMHALLLVAMNVGPFSPATWVYYLAMIEPDEWTS